MADAVWDEALSGHTTAGTAGLALATASSGGVDPSVLADAIWDEALSGHATAGTTGKKLTDLANADTSGLATSAELAKVTSPMMMDFVADAPMNPISSSIAETGADMVATSLKSAVTLCVAEARKSETSKAAAE